MAPKHSLRTAAVLLSGLAALTALASPAFAQTSSEDVQACRLAALEQTQVDLSGYDLEFDRAQSRKIFLDARPGTEAGDTYVIKCVMPKRSSGEIKVELEKK